MTSKPENLLPYWMTIEQEIALLKPLLLHPAGFDLDLQGMLSIRPINEACPPTKWEVAWEDQNGSDYLEFDDLDQALLCFVHIRHQYQYGLDYETLLVSKAVV
jgi:hypothetical protein